MLGLRPGANGPPKRPWPTVRDSHTSGSRDIPTGIRPSLSLMVLVKGYRLSPANKLLTAAVKNGMTTGRQHLGL